MWFDKKKCAGGLEALKWYHEKFDDIRNMGLGPNHDWSSHGADSFGLMAVAYEAPRPYIPRKGKTIRAMAGKDRR
jgi:phage terminase large subunit